MMMDGNKEDGDFEMGCIKCEDLFVRRMDARRHASVMMASSLPYRLCFDGYDEKRGQ